MSSPKKRKEYWMSYSSFKLYRECPKHYKLRKIEKVKPLVKDSKHNAIVGSVVQRVYEDFYNKEMYRDGEGVSQRLLALVDGYFYEFIDKEYVDFSDIKCHKTMEEFRQDCHTMVPKVLQGIKDHMLVGPYARSEISVRGHLEKNFFITGRIDFIIRTSNNEIILMDGKASVHREKYVDPDQLLFYALVFHLAHDKIPDKTGYFYFHYADEKERAIDWKVPAKEDLVRIRTEVRDTFTAIQRKEFKATPSSKACQYCEFANICTERQAILKQKRAKKRWKAIEDGKEVVPETISPVAFIGFGGKVIEDT